MLLSRIRANRRCAIQIRYVIGSVVGTLACVEEPGSKMLVETQASDVEDLDKKDTDRLLEPEIAVVNVLPATRNIRSAVAHLKAVHGRKAGMRGFGLWILLIVLRSVLFAPLSAFLPGHSAVLGLIAAEVALAKLKMTWVHHVIAAPESGGKWYKRKESFAVPWVKIAPAALLDAAAFQIATSLPTFLACTHPDVHKALHNNFEDVPFETVQQGVLLLVGSLLGSLIMMVLVYIPAHVTFVRVAASLLPEQHDTSVAFDRSFGGRLASGESVSMALAWTTFNWEQRRRYLRLMAGLVAMLIAISVMAFGIIALECNILFDDLSTQIKALKQN